MKNKILFILTGIALILTLFFIKSSYAIFDSKKNMVVKTDIAKWQVLVNSNNVNLAENFIIDNFNSDNLYVKEGKIAPDVSGYFDIEIDPNGTQVSFSYEISFDFTGLDERFVIDNVIETNGYEITNEGNKYFGKILLSDIKNGVKHNIRVYIKWINNEDNNEIDSNIGLEKGYSINIPVNIVIKQFLG